VQHLGKTYGEGESTTVAIADISFSVKAEEFVCLVGPSGCGKTTLLKCMSGLMRPTRGSVVLRGVPVDRPPEDMALVFQDYSASLMPWLTVHDNVLLPLRHKTLAKAKRERLVGEAVSAVGLDGFSKHYPWQLSGGMQQRVAIARAIAYQPAILLMDEPFASVDAQTRADLEDLMLDLCRRFRMTVLFVTHDIDESVYLGDRIVVLSSRPTTVQQVLDVGLPSERNQVDTKLLPRFAELRAEVYALIRGAGSIAKRPATIKKSIIN
jgi:NitT/TauT family transport system ATP-binding protein